MKRIITLVLAGAVMLSVGIWAVAAPGPQEMVEGTVDQVIAKLKQDGDKIKANPDHLKGLVDEYVLPRFDFERMSQWVLGKHWRRATDEQKQQFIAAFKSLLVRTYATSLSEFAGQKIIFQPFRGDMASGDVTIRSEVAQPGGFPIPINYSLHRKGEEWKVYDVTIDDVSLIANYRTSFNNEIRRSSLDKLIAKLSDKNG